MEPKSGRSSLNPDIYIVDGKMIAKTKSANQDISTKFTVELSYCICWRVVGLVAWWLGNKCYAI